MAIKRNCWSYMKRFVVFAFLLSCFFPFLRVIPFNADNQPNAILLGVAVLLALRQMKMKREFVLLFGTLLFAFGCLLFSSPDSIGLSLFLVYFNLFFIPYVSYLSLDYVNGIPYSFFKKIIWIWGGVGLIQRFVNPKFLTFLLYRSGENMLGTGRGITSLAVEPTYYGMICLILMMMVYMNFQSEAKYKHWIAFLGVQLVVFTMSTTCLLILIASGICFAVYRLLLSENRIKILFVSIVIVGGIYYVLSTYVVTLDLRFANAVRKLLEEDPSNFIVMDESVNNRFMHAFYPIKGFFDNWGMPHGFAGYGNYLWEMSHNELHWKYLQYAIADIETARRVPTMLGAPLFELGVFSFPIFYVIVKSFRPFLKDPKIVLCVFVLFFLSLNAISYTNALVGLFIGNLIYLSHQKVKFNNAINKL